MLINEYRKMWNFKILAVVIAVGIAMFFSGPVSQMNLEKNLPLFETVEASIGTEFRQKYGKELDAGEMEEIKELAQAKSEALNEEVMKAFPEIPSGRSFPQSPPVIITKRPTVPTAGFPLLRPFSGIWECSGWDSCFIRNTRNTTFRQRSRNTTNSSTAVI